MFGVWMGNIENYGRFTVPDNRMGIELLDWNTLAGV